LGAAGAVAPEPPNEKAGAAADGAWVAVAPKANAPPAAGSAAFWPKAKVGGAAAALGA